MSYEWTKPLLLSNKISLSSRIMPSPMEGIMTPLFCQAVNELNCFDYWITPFIPISSSILTTYSFAPPCFGPYNALAPPAIVAKINNINLFYFISLIIFTININS